MAEKRLDIIIGGTDAGATAALSRVAAEAKKFGQVERTLAEARREYLQTEAANGSEVAAFELERLAVAKQYTTQRERIAAILKSEAADDAQRQQAQLILLELVEQEAAAVERITVARKARLAGPGGQQDDHVAAFRAQKEFQDWLVASKAKEATDQREFQGWLAQERAEALSIERTMHAAREHSLRTEAEAGSAAAAVELKRMGVATAFAAQRERLNAILKSEAATTQQRLEAEALLVRLTQQEAAAMERVAIASASASGGGGGLLKGMKSQLGEDSSIGLAMKTLQGAGAAAAVGLIARMLADATGKAAELRAEFEAGRKSAGDVADELARSLPVLGNIYTAGRNIRELFTGENAMVAAIRTEAAAMDRLAESRRQVNKAGEQAVLSMAKTLRDLKAEGLLAGLQGSVAGDLGRANFDAVKRREDIREQADREKKNILDAGTEEVETDTPEGRKKVSKTAAQRQAQLEGQVNDLRSRLAEAQQRVQEYGAEGDGEVGAFGMAALQERAKLQKQLDNAEAALKGIQGIVEKQVAAIAKVDAAAREALRQNAENLTGSTARTLTDFGSKFRENFEKQAKEEAERRKSLREKEEKEAREAAAKQERTDNRRGQIDDNLRRDRMFLAEQEAAAGRLSSLELERLKIAEQFNDKRRELNKILKDELATEEQKRSAKGLLASLDNAEADALGRAKGGKEGARFAAAQDTRLSGSFFAMKDSIAKELTEPPEVKAINATAKKIDATNEALKGLSEKLDAVVDFVSGIGVYGAGPAAA